MWDASQSDEGEAGRGLEGRGDGGRDGEGDGEELEGLVREHKFERRLSALATELRLRPLDTRWGSGSRWMVRSVWANDDDVRGVVWLLASTRGGAAGVWVDWSTAGL